MLIKIMRHGARQDVSNPISWLSGLFCNYFHDTSLSYYGHQTSIEKGKALKNKEFNPKWIFTSPYQRTIETANNIRLSFPESSFDIIPLLAEYQPNYAQRINCYKDSVPTNYYNELTEFSYPETHEQFKKRVVFTINKLINKCNNLQNDTNILVVTHAEFVRCFIDYLSKVYPDLVLDSNNITYLSSVTFEYDVNTGLISENNIIIDY
jgi:broad specificity phosphatase PhoE